MSTALMPGADFCHIVRMFYMYSYLHTGNKRCLLISVDVYCKLQLFAESDV